MPRNRNEYFNLDSQSIKINIRSQRFAGLLEGGEGERKCLKKVDGSTNGDDDEHSFLGFVI